MTELEGKLQRLREQATPGPWTPDTVQSVHLSANPHDFALIAELVNNLDEILGALEECRSRPPWVEPSFALPIPDKSMPSDTAMSVPVLVEVEGRRWPMIDRYVHNPRVATWLDAPAEVKRWRYIYAPDDPTGGDDA